MALVNEKLTGPEGAAWPGSAVCVLAHHPVAKEAADARSKADACLTN